MGSCSSKNKRKSSGRLKLHQVESSQKQKQQQQSPSSSLGAKIAESHLGKLSPDHFRLGKLLLKSSTLFECPEGLEMLWTVSTFVFSRKSERHNGGFGFYCEISLNGDEEEGKLVAYQQQKPKRGFKEMEDGPVDIFDASMETNPRQVLGILLTKTAAEQPLFEGVKVYSIPGVIGFVIVRGDYTRAFEIRNVQDEVILVAERFNRLSGGFEYQISSAGKGEQLMCIATLVRLEESKFILKLYSPFPPLVKALMVSFTLFLIYLIAR